MKTKTLLIAAAALAAGVISSQAQVYSQNVVGYANVVCPGGVNVLLTTPLTTGNDVMTNVLAGAPPGTTVQFWDPVGGNFSIALTFSGPPSNRHWKDGASVIQDNYPIAPGTGYFLSAGSDYTNTFVGTVVALNGGTATNFVPGAANYLVGSLVPYAGSVSNAAALALIPPPGTTIQKWDPIGQGFNAYTFSGPPSNRTWKDANNVVSTPDLGVAEGFFMLGGGDYNWIQTLQP